MGERKKVKVEAELGWDEVEEKWRRPWVVPFFFFAALGGSL